MVNSGPAPQRATPNTHLPNSMHDSYAADPNPTGNQGGTLSAAALGGPAPDGDLLRLPRTTAATAPFLESAQFSHKHNGHHCAKAGNLQD